MNNEHEPRRRPPTRRRMIFSASSRTNYRTTVSAVLGWASAIRKRQLNGDALTVALDAIERNAQIQSHLVQDILDRARIVTGRLRLDRQIVSISEILQSGRRANATDIRSQSPPVDDSDQGHRISACLRTRCGCSRCLPICCQMPRSSRLPGGTSRSRPPEHREHGDSDDQGRWRWHQPGVPAACIRRVSAGSSHVGLHVSRPGARPVNREALRGTSRRE